MAPSSGAPHPARMPAHLALPGLSAPLIDEAAHCVTRLRDSDDPELVHRFRVSLRQLRSLLWAYAPLLPEGLADPWRARLGALADLAGTAREWTVLATELAPAIVPHDPARAQALLHILERRATRANEACRRALVKAAPAAALSELREAIAGWSAAQVRSVALEAFAARRLHAAYRILRKRAADPHAAIGALHRARIAVKRVHYLTLLFAPVLPTPTVRRLKQLKRLQLHLGHANDTAAAIALLQRPAPRLCGHRLHRLASSRLSRLHARSEAKARRALTRAWKRLGA